MPANPAARSGPTSSTTSPTVRRTCRAPAPRSGPRPRAGWTPSSAPWGPAAPWQALRDRKPEVQIGLADPHGAALYSYYTDGELKAEGTSISEGIGQGRITANLEGLKIDRAYRISDEEMLLAIYDLVEHEGLVMGGSTGINVAGAIRMAKDMGPGHTIVTVLCDHGQRYQSKIFNPLFLKERGLPPPPWLPE